MLVSQSFSVAMEIKIIFLNSYNCYNINIFTSVIREHGLNSNLQLSNSIFCKNNARLAVARGHLVVAMCDNP